MLKIEPEDLDDAMRNADLSLVPQHLRRGKAESVLMGPKNDQYPVLWARSGTYATVYKLNLGGQRFRAIRCFMTDVGTGMRDRYRCLTQLLKSKASPFTVTFEYHENGIQIPRLRTRLPILEMEWVEGRTLTEEVGELCGARKTGELRALSQKWQSLILQMNQVGMAHGDLAGENVMVRNDKLVLIDYDGIFFDNPALTKDPPREVGQERYQHPEAKNRAYDKWMDDFSALVIYVALRAYAEKPDLFGPYGRVKDGQLLFTKADFASPSESPAFRDLEKIQDSEVRKLVDFLCAACGQPISKVPHFAALVDPFVPLRELLRSSPPDWGRIHEAATNCRKASPQKPFPPDLSKAADEAKARVEALDELERLLTAKGGYSAYEVTRFYSSKGSLLENWKQADAAVVKAQEAEKQVGKLEELQKATPHDRGPNGLVQVWTRHQKALKGCTERDRWERDAGLWSRRNDACARFLSIVQQKPRRSDIAVADAWSALVAVGGHPDALPHKDDACECVKRRDCLAGVRGIRDSQDEASDREWAKRWDDKLLAACPDAANERKQWEEATRRLRIINAIQDAVAQVDRGLAEEEQIVHAAQGIPARYKYVLESRVRTAHARADARREFKLAWAASPRSDLRLADVWESWNQAGGRISATQQQRQDAEEAVRRAKILRPIRDLVGKPISPEIDRCLVDQWDAQLLPVSDDAQRLAPRIAEAGQRLAQLVKLTEAIAAVDKGATGAATVKDAGEKLPRDYLEKSSAIFQRYKTAEKQAACTRRLEQALSAKSPSDYVVADAYDELQKSDRELHAKPDPAVTAAFRQEAEKARLRRDRLERIKAVHKTYDERSDRAILDAWDDTLLADRGDAQQYLNRILQAKERIPKLDTLRERIRQADRGTAGETTIVVAEAQLDDQYLRASLTSGERERILRAHSRDKCTRALQKALDDPMPPSPSDYQITSEFGSLTSVGWDATANPLRGQAELACERVKRLDAIKEVWQVNDEASDRRILQYWDEALLFGRRDAQRYIPRVRSAQDRIPKLGRLRDAIQRVEQKNAGEAAIVTAAAGLDESYLRTLSQKEQERIACARHRAPFTEELEAAIARDCDRDTARCWQELQAAGGDPAADHRRRRAEIAIRRAEGLQCMEKTFREGHPADVEDVRIIQLWDDYQLHESRDALSSLQDGILYCERVAQARRRRARYQQFEDALSQSDDFLIAEIGSDPLLQGYPPVIEEKTQARIEQAKRDSRSARELLELLNGQPNSQQFIECFQERIVKRYPQEFRPFLPRIRDLIQRHLFSRYPLSIDQQHPRAEPLNSAGEMFRVHWHWRIDKISSCIVTAVWDRVIESLPNGFEKGSGYTDMEVTPQNFERNECSAPLQLPVGSGTRVHISVWPLVVLAASEEPVVGPPLRLEPIVFVPEESPRSSVPGRLRNFVGRLFDM